MAQLEKGNKAPDFALKDQNGVTVALKDFSGRKLFIYFYPKANTSGWTVQSQAVRDALPELRKLGVSALGISPDEPAEQKSFAEKYNLGFPLLSDPDHRIAAAYDVWGTKQMFGKSLEGIVRSAFLIDANGHIAHTWYKISPNDTVPELLKALAG